MAKKKKSTLSLWIMLAAIILLAVVIFLMPSCGTNTDKATRVEIGQQAPSFTVEMLDGSAVTLDSLRGKVVLLNFWATWCPPCRAELQRVQSDVVDRFADASFVFLPISRGEDRATVEAFRTQNDYRFPMGLDPRETIFGLYASEYIPRNFLIDKQGKIVKISIGYTPEEFEELLGDIDGELQKL